MLREIHIRNLAVLAEASVSLGPGLNILSGETGAGQVDRRRLAGAAGRGAGQRGDDPQRRRGAYGERRVRAGGAAVAAGAGGRPGWRWRAARCWSAARSPRSGRNRVFVNDQPTTLRLLADLAPVPAAHPWPARRAGAHRARAADAGCWTGAAAPRGRRCWQRWRRLRSAHAPRRAAGAADRRRPGAP